MASAVAVVNEPVCRVRAGLGRRRGGGCCVFLCMRMIPAMGKGVPVVGFWDLGFEGGGVSGLEMLETAD